jgi:hypothetical protein
VFAPYKDVDCPLESTSLLVEWIGQSIDQVVEATPSLADTLPTPTTASTFFHHITSTRNSTSLQRRLSSQAASNSHKAFLTRCHEMKKKDGGAMLAHAMAVSAPRAWAWKNVTPTTPETDLSDEHYRIADRLSLRLPPINAMQALPDDCPLCNRKNVIRLDAYHFLSCKMTKRSEVTGRHDEVVNVLYRTALMMGIQAVREPTGLDSSDGRCPDLQLVLPGRHIISDVSVTHPLGPSNVKNRQSWTTTGAARAAQRGKHDKYKNTAAQRKAELLPFCLETYGGMAPDAIKLLSAMGSMGNDQLGVWPRHVIIRYLVSAVATSVQRGNAVTWLSAYSRAIAAMSQRRTASSERAEEEEEEEEIVAEDREV